MSNNLAVNISLLPIYQYWLNPWSAVYVRAGGRSPWVVCVRWEDEAGVVHIFRSRYLYFNPQGILTSDQVPVFIEENGGGYFVDIDAVLPEIRMH